MPTGSKSSKRASRSKRIAPAESLYNAFVQGSFEHFDHTADMGIRLRADSLAELISPAVAGLYAAIGELHPADAPKAPLAHNASPLDKGGRSGVRQSESLQSASEAFRFEATAPDPAILLRDFLTEVLNLFERDQRILTSYEHIHWHSTSGEFQLKWQNQPTPHRTEYRLEVAARSAPLDPVRSVFYREVKAITYHDLKIREIDGGFEATFIVDI